MLHRQVLDIDPSSLDISKQPGQATRRIGNLDDDDADLHHLVAMLTGDLACPRLPDAQVRVLLVADPAVRIARRQAELGEKVDMEQVIDSIVRRDRDDSTVSTFEQPAEGVTLVDSTHLDLEQVIDAVIGLVPQSLR